MGYCYYILSGALYYLDMLENIQKQAHCATGPRFADSLVLKKIIVIRSISVSSIGTPLEDARLNRRSFSCTAKL